MPHRYSLLELLARYHPTELDQVEQKDRIKNFVVANDDCFLRSNLMGHVTSSCWLLSPQNDSVLLTHHKKIGRWLQLGGHCDGDSDVRAVALREAKEESGVSDIHFVSEDIFDLDIHVIAEHGGVSKHLHYDVRFVLRAGSTDYRVSAESHALAWAPIAELAKDSYNNKTLARMAKRWLMGSN
jgi:8-oxo-dGTP pyrophosphatase MutT (NUDIX family)